jgi:hypothetical protein
MAEIQVGSIVIIHFQFSSIQKIRKLRFKPCDCGMCLSHLCKECGEGRGGARFKSSAIIWQDCVAFVAGMEHGNGYEYFYTEECGLCNLRSFSARPQGQRCSPNPLLGSAAASDKYHTLSLAIYDSLASSPIEIIWMSD